MSFALPPSSSRIYIHNIEYKGKNCIDKSEAKEIICFILKIRSQVINDLQFQGIKVFNIHNLNSTSSEIHICNVMYYLQRVLTLDLIDKLRNILSKELKKIPEFSFEQINIINDEYVITPTVGYYDGE